MKLFSEYNLGNIALKNRIVMAPMTRSRAINNIPNQLMATYYAQRSSAGLLVTEGVAPSANGLGYARIPGLFSKEQIEGWKLVTSAVHEKGGKIFAQIMHTGRASHSNNMPEGSEVLSASSVKLSGEMYTDQAGPQAYPEPKEMTIADIEQAQQEYVTASENAIKAGFDGVEIHAANGYLIDQFNNTASNHRTDEYGGSAENRNRFALEVATKIAKAIGAEKTGIRLSPFGVFNDMEIFDGLEEQFIALSAELGKLNLAYLHIVDHSSMGAPALSDSIKGGIKQAFAGTIILSGGYSKERAEADLTNNNGELIAFGRDLLSTPDLVHRLENDIELNAPNFDTFYTPGEAGYTDYPFASK